MFSSTMHDADELAIDINAVTKTYRLHGSQKEQLADVLGFNRIRKGKEIKEHVALDDICLKVPKGHRIGIVGRNGAGKTTLLKLICGNYSPSLGTVSVNGSVQALMNIGLGFHPEYTGRENVEASLQYNGLAKDQYDAALAGVIEFCELGEYLDQPFKTYSMGMQARLMFAAATAIHPDILIVDEVLGAGDGYFVAKSKARVESLIKNGCTMLLVSHSMQQVLELCDEAIWLDKGKIRMQGPAFDVVKSYEEYLHGPISEIKLPERSQGSKESQSTEQSGISVKKESEQNDAAVFRFENCIDGIKLQEPKFLPHNKIVNLPAVDVPTELKFQVPGGISRWDSVVGIKINGFTLVTEKGETNELVSMRPAKALFSLIAELDSEFECRYALAVYDHFGKCVLDIVSPIDKFFLTRGKQRNAEMLLNPLQLGPGEYTISISAHAYDKLEVFNATPRYDLISRSFGFRVELPESLTAIETQFYHSAEWGFE